MKLSELQLKFKKILFICEKPDAASKIAAALPGKMIEKNGYFECEGGIIVGKLAGHVLSLAEPEDYNKSWEKWDISTMPIIVNTWKNTVTPSKKRMFDTVKELINNADCIVNAADPDREGQLLVDEVIEYCKSKKPVYRFLGGNNLEISALQKSFNEIQDNKNFESFRDSAKARQRADWTIGMNITRLMTLYMQQLGFPGTSPAGRVKTPTMALVVDNINTIANFKSVQHYSLKTSYTKNDITFSTNWQMPKNIEGLDPDNRLIDINVINKIVQQINDDKEAIVTAYKAESKKEKHPLCFSLSTITNLAGKKYGYKPDQVLAVCQYLYEQEILTYPRSEKEYLPDSQFSDAQANIDNICSLPHFAHHITKINTKIKSRVWVDSADDKVSPHHAIIPTLKKFNYEALAEAEKHIYDLAATMFIAQFYPEHEYNQTTIELCIGDQTFKAVGKTTTKAGWRELFGKDDSDEESEKNETSQKLPVLEEGEQLPLKSVDIITKKTTPPKPFTQTTLLDAMKNIHLYVKDKKIKEILKETEGIGTAATRSNIVKELCESRQSKDLTGAKITIPSLLEERGKKGELYPSPKALKMYEIMPAELKSPDTTAIWEKALNDIVTSKGDIEPFTSKINAMITSIVNPYKNIITPKVVKAKPEIPYNAATCPKCKKGKMLIRKGSKGDFYGCSNFPKCKHTDKIASDIPII